MTCTCNQYRAPKCPEGERLYQLDKEAYEEVMDARVRCTANDNAYNRREFYAAQDAYTEARKAWLDHRTGDAGEPFMERVREFTEKTDAIEGER